MYPSKGKPVQGLRIETEVCMTRNLFMLKCNVFILRCTGFCCSFHWCICCVHTCTINTLCRHANYSCLQSSYSSSYSRQFVLTVIYRKDCEYLT